MREGSADGQAFSQRVPREREDQTLTLAGKTAIVTGAASGIGAEIVALFMREGSRIVVADIEGNKVERIVRETAPLGAPIFPFCVDVSVKAQVLAMIDFARKRLGRIDILVNCAGICEVLQIEDITEERWDQMMAVNLKGTFLCCQAVLPIMKEQGGGRIINLASLAGRTGGEAVGAHYAVAKAGVICLTKVLAKALAPYGATANAIAPAITDTPMARLYPAEDLARCLAAIPLGRIGHPRDVAAAALFLASDDACFITGQTLDVNGGSWMG